MNVRVTPEIGVKGLLLSRTDPGGLVVSPPLIYAIRAAKAESGQQSVGPLTDDSKRVFNLFAISIAPTGPTSSILQISTL